MDAFAEVKPKLIVAVPLIIEKIIKTKVFPLLDKPLMKLMLMIPVLDTQLLSKIKYENIFEYVSSPQEQAWYCPLTTAYRNLFSNS